MGEEAKAEQGAEKGGCGCGKGCGCGAKRCCGCKALAALVLLALGAVGGYLAGRHGSCCGHCPMSAAPMSAPAAK